MAALRDGSEVIIRPVTPADRAMLRSGFARFGDRSRHQRFFGVKVKLTEAELAFLTEVDHHDHEALGAIDVRTGAGVGIARFIRLEPGAPVAEAAGGGGARRGRGGGSRWSTTGGAAGSAVRCWRRWCSARPRSPSTASRRR